MYLSFDTSVLIELERENKDILSRVQKLKETYPASPKIPFISYYEFLHGTRNRNLTNKAKAEAFIDLFEVLAVTKTTAKILSQFKEKYELPFPDLFIAAQTKEQDAILVTRDKDFERIEELKKIVI